MAVDKFRPGKIKHEIKPYTIILNKALEDCEYLEALGLWCHFQSKTENWIINVPYVMKKFHIGKDKAYKLLNFLISIGLMDRIQEKNANGTYGETNYLIKNGEDIKYKKGLPYHHQPFPDFPEAAKPDTVNKEHINKRNKKIKEKEKKRESKKRLPLSENFSPNDENKELIAKRGLDEVIMLLKFKAWIERDGKRFNNYQAAFNKFILDERLPKNISKPQLKAEPKAAVNQMPIYSSTDSKKTQADYKKSYEKYRELIRKSLGGINNGR